MRNLNQRELILVRVLIALIAIAVVYFIIISPFLAYTESSDFELQDSMARLKKLEKIYEEYKEIQEQTKNIKRDIVKKESTTSLVEQLAGKLNISRNISYTRRNQSTVQQQYVRVTTDVKFEGISIDKIFKFIYEIENSGSLLSLNYIRINKGLKGTNKYDVILKIDSYTTH